MIEEFRDVKGYEEEYKVSDLGRVLSLKHGKERVLKQTINNRYFTVNLYENGKRSTKIIHKLVAIAFLNHEPNGYEIVVDHIDNNKLNNHVNNLQLISNRENCSKDSKRKHSKHLGISYRKTRDSWKGKVMFKGKIYYTKSVKTEEEAYELYKILLNELNLVNYNEIN